MNDPLGAFRIIAGLPPSRPEDPNEWKIDLLFRISRAWLDDDPHTALTWLDKIPDREGKATLARWIADSGRQPTEATRFPSKSPLETQPLF